MDAGVQESSRHSRISAAATLSNKWKPEDSSGKTKKTRARLGGRTAGTDGRRDGDEDEEEEEEALAPLLQGRTVAGPGQRLPLSRVSLGLRAKAAM